MGKLVIHRRNGESFFITDDISVRISSVKGGQVKLSIEAPEHVNVYRSELRSRFVGTQAGETAQELDVDVRSATA